MTAPDRGVRRAEFMARVSNGLGRASTAEPAAAAPVADEAIARVTRADEDMAAVFEARAAEAGMIVHRAASAGVVKAIGSLLIRLGIRRVAMAEALAGLAQDLGPLDVEVVAWQGAGGFEPLYAADAGIADVQSAVAETGTLVCSAGPGQGRGLSLVPPVHIAVVRASQIVPDLVDFWTSQARQSVQPSSLVLIAGPSKTADIEGILITGVHGPREVHILLVEDA